LRKGQDEDGLLESLSSVYWVGALGGGIVPLG
jgi:hypothetical protein